MEELKKGIKKIRSENTNFESRHFIPETPLAELLCESSIIKSALRSLGVEVHEVADLADRIKQGARKCFGILILIDQGKSIADFIRYDALQLTSPDHRLPYTSETLQQIFSQDGESQIVKDFLERQWEFAIPMMHPSTVFRELDKRTILPFLDQEPAGEGAMGSVWRIKLHPQCHKLSSESHTVIRKQIKFRDKDKDRLDFQKELRNVALLAGLKHSNIVQLHCAYIYRQEYNLIFAVADGGPLTQLLNGKQGSEGLNGSQLLLGLTGLSSAINAIHNFTSKVHDISLSGCHHDLAPRNILIHGTTFLLADFGFSSFKTLEEDSLTTFEGVDDAYAAPEYGTSSDGQAQVRRASDIWSFGCILAEVLTYMEEGSAGVKTFREKRNFECAPGLWRIRFHRGPQKYSPDVTHWLDRLQESKKPYCMHMISLIKKMLSMNPKDRPISAEIEQILRGISIVFIADSISVALDRECNSHPDIHLILGSMRFRSWHFAFNQLFDDRDRIRLGDFDYDFDRIVQTLKEIHNMVGHSEPIHTTSQQQSLLRYHHDMLSGALPSRYSSVAINHFRNQVLQNDSERLRIFSEAIAEIGDETSIDGIGALAAVKHLTILADEGSLARQTNLVLDPGDIALKNEIDIHQTALLRSQSENVLVEWLAYDVSWTDENIGMQLRSRLESIVALLHNDSTKRIPGTLRCIGYFHYPAIHAFGVVHGLPFSETQPITLRGLLQKEKSFCPLLEDRFRLAFDICNCIHTFHQVGWLHRNLHSMNVIFFPREGAGDAEWAKEPRVLGFARGRENCLSSFTHGPNSDPQLRHYQHPEYLKHTERYKEEFDYYSVGMLLLEIGLWKTLPVITESRRFQNVTDEQYRKEVIRTRVPHLGATMGTRYMEATRSCLVGAFTGPSKDLGDTLDTRDLSFRNLVMDQIQLMD